MTLLATLLAPIVASDMYQSMKTLAQGLGLLTSSWVSTDPEDAIYNSTAQTVAPQWNSVATVAIQSGFLDTCALIGNPTGDPSIPASSWMLLLASTVYNVTPNPATFATGGWTGTNSTGGNLGPYSPGQLKFYSLDNNSITYSNRDNVTFVPGANAPITVVADVIGSVSNVAPSRLALLTTVLGLSGSNALGLNGNNAESGPSMANRCRLKYYSLSPNGPSQAYQYVALTFALNGGVSVNRVWVSPSSTNGSVKVIFASPSGPPVNGATDVTAVDTALRALALPDCVSLTTQGAVAHSIAVNWTAYYHTAANVTPATEVTNGDAALGTAFSLLPIGGESIPSKAGSFVFTDAVKDFIGRSLPKAFDIIVGIGAGQDEPINPGEVPTLGTVTPSAVVVA